MFSKKTIVIAGAIVLIALNVIVFSFSYIRKSSVVDAAAGSALFVVSPFQTLISSTINFFDDIWDHYFFLISAAKENEYLKKELARSINQKNECREIKLANVRLKEFVNLKLDNPFELLAAEVVAKDPSPWFRTIIIDKGISDGVSNGLPVIVSAGIVGYVLNASSGYAKIILVTDRNSSVDALVQRTRARGIAQGITSGLCRFDYTLRKLDVTIGDVIVTSGFDGIYPKGLRIGSVSKVIRRNSGLFQDIELIPYVDFEKLEEVMVILNPPIHDFVSK